MLTQEKVLEALKAGRSSQTLDSRDYGRLAEFFPEENLHDFGFKKKDGVEWKPRPWDEDAIKSHLKDDLEFAFEKALNKRGLSAGAMYEVIKMWLWVLDDPLQHFDSYAQYGLPLFKAVAVKYGFPNPIGDDAGNEYKYSSEADYG